MSRELHANEILKRYKSNCLVMKIIKYLFVIIAFFIAYLAISGRTNMVWGYIFDIFVLILIIAFRFLRELLVLKFNTILNTDCDPFVFVEVYQLLQKEDKNNRGIVTITTNIAKGLFLQGKFDDSYELIKSVTPNYQNTSLMLLYYNVLSNCCGILERHDEYNYVTEKIQQVSNEQKPNSPFKKMAEQLLKDIELGRLEKENDVPLYAKMIDDSLQNARTNLEKVSLHYKKAKLNVKLLNYDIAKESCVYVIKNGNRLFVVNEAKKILDNISAS